MSSPAALFGATPERRRSSRLQSALADGKSGFESKLADVGPSFPRKECGACLLEIDTVSKDGDFLAVLDACRPAHFFHIRCIFTWTQQENSCPLCKQRFSAIGVYGENGDLQRVSRVEERDQNFDEEGEGEEEDAICQVCQRGDREADLLLCDGHGGRCSGAAHYFCVGLPAVPEGEWYCQDCQELPVSSQVTEEASQGSMDLSPVKIQLELRDDEADVEVVGGRLGSRRKVKPEEQRQTPRSGGSSSSSAPAASVKEENLQSKKIDARRGSGSAASASSAGEAFAGLCREMPKWISRQGRQVRVDLGGRRMRDAAAAVIAQVVEVALKQVKGADADLGVSLLLAGNRLHKAGTMSLLKAVSEAGLRISHLDLERNKLESSAVVWLAGWLARQPGGPPDELRISQNAGIRTAAARALLYVFGRCRNSQGRSTPLWIEARHIGFDGSALEELSEQVSICLAMDRSVCGPTCCASLQDGRSPRLHLPGILEQQEPDAGDEMDVEVPRAKPYLSAILQAAPKDEMPSFRFPSEGLEEAEEMKEEEAPGQGTRGQGSGLRPGRGRGSRRGRGRGATVDARQSVEGGPASAEELEREARRSWADSLGRRVAKDIESQDPEPTPAPSAGLWDLVRAQEKAKKKKRKLAESGEDPRQVAAEPAQAAWVPLAWVPETVKAKPVEMKAAEPKEAKANPEEEDGEGYHALQRVVLQRLLRESRLWAGLSVQERRLRRKCLAEQLARQAWGKYFKVVVSSPGGSWPSFLRTSLGHQRIHQWLDKKVTEALHRTTARTST